MSYRSDHGAAAIALTLDLFYGAIVFDRFLFLEEFFEEALDFDFRLKMSLSPSDRSMDPPVGLESSFFFVDRFLLGCERNVSGLDSSLLSPSLMTSPSMSLRMLSFTSMSMA